MAYRLTEVIEKLADSVDLLELTERLGIPFKKVGQTVQAQCQFHDDSNPSMVLYNGTGERRQHYHCFSCNTTADIFKLTAARKGLNFNDSVEWLAKTYAVKLPSGKSSGSKASTNKVVAPKENSNYFEMALDIYRQNNAKDKLDEWLNTREFSPNNDVLDDLLYVRRNTLTNFLTSSTDGYAINREKLGNLEDVNLVQADHTSYSANTPGDSFLNVGKQYRDFFFDDRVLFPLRDLIGKIEGFAGRKVSQDGKSAKFLYTRGVSKTSMLYGAHLAFPLLKKRAGLSGQYADLYVCEGLMDALRLLSLGLPAVSLLGASLSERQCEEIIRLAKGLPKTCSLRLYVFLDRDKAGLKGAAATIRSFLEKDISLAITLKFVWPIVDVSGALVEGKDPDELLRAVKTEEQAAKSIASWTHPPALAILSDELGVLPDEILSDPQWSLISLSRRYQAVSNALGYANNVVERLIPREDADALMQTWKADFTRFSELPTPTGKNNALTRLATINDDDARLNLARELAESGIRRGELSSDVAAWNRLDISATAFYMGIKARLQQKKFSPMEPFDAVFVSRGFGKSEPRIKTIACPEELVAQQYLLNELLTERFDGASSQNFSDFIPAVRYERRKNRTWTTGYDGEKSVTLSFAYQIDMDVLEGRQPAHESGIFRPYFDCWKDFISSVTKQSSEMTEVFMIRLDVRRYYDELRKTAVRDALRHPIDRAFATLAKPSEFAAWFRPFENDNERQQAVLDWLLDQSFGFSYYDPGTGEVTPSKHSDKGIPQGPILSAWLATAALFPLDKALGAQLRIFNSEGRVRAGYARYVDDIILLADSEEVLGVLRAAAQDAAQLLQVELVAKETVDPMSADDFAKHLTEGRALAVSGPIGEINLIPAGDGDLGWHSLAAPPPKRYAALQLLRDQTLYFCPPDRLLDQVSTALHAEELRPSELAKASRWLWYWAAGDASADTVSEIVSRYWDAWRAVCAGASWTLDPQANAWDDPAFYALEGVEKLLESAHWGEDSLSLDANQRRLTITARVATVARTIEFIEILAAPQQGSAPAGWGAGTSVLSRMFWQRALGMRWKAAKLMPLAVSIDSDYAVFRLDQLSSVSRVSLRRALITDAETANAVVAVSAQRGQAERNPNIVRDAMLWLHEAFVRLGVDSQENETNDPLLEISNELNEFMKRASAMSEGPRTKEFIALLVGLCPGTEGSISASVGEEWVVVHPMALAAFVAICPRKHVIRLLADRAHLLPKDDSPNQRVVLPSLPGIPSPGLFSITLTEEQKQSPSREIEKIQWFTVKRVLDEANEEDAPTQISLVTSSAVSAPLPLQLIWTQNQDQHLQVATAKWDVEWPRKILVSTGLPKTGPHQLQWAADVFEALARANHQLQEVSNYEFEYVPAWTNFVVNRWPDEKGERPVLTSLISIPTASEKISGVAYIRNGSRGLKSYDIQKADGHFWRAGVMLTELLGYAEELDKYSALEIPQGEDPETTSPDRHLLRNVLRKMRGHYSRMDFMPRRKDKPHMPASLERSLQLLRNYPTDDVGYAGVAYVLAAEMETRAMGFRLASELDPGQPGALTDFLQRVARDVCGRIPLGWASKFPVPETAHQIEPERAASNAWWNMAQRFQQFGDLEDIGWRALLLGLRVAVVGEWLRSLVLELNGAPAQQWLIPETAFVDEVWGIELPFFCNDDASADYSRLVFRFNTAIAEGRPLQSFEFITPLGWLTLAAGRLGVLDDTKRTPFIQWSNDERAEFKRMAHMLASSHPISLNEEGTENCNWPFEHIADQDEADQKILFNDLLAMLATVDRRCGLKIKNCIGPWRFDPKAKQFTDTSGETWVFPPWRISITDGFAPEEVTSDDRILRAWSETRADGGRLLGVAARGKRLSSLLSSLHGKTIANSASSDSSPVIATTKTTLIEIPTRPANTVSVSEKLEKPEGRTLTDSEKPLTATSSHTHEPAATARVRLRNLQASAWAAREEKNDAHVRVAIMQWDVCDSYRHPLYDIDAPSNVSTSAFANANETLRLNAIKLTRNQKDVWKEGALLPSWAEFRRRRLLSEALRACMRFKVDMLVLPEYSVRPDTVKWLRDYLVEREINLSIVAGTYRLYGNSSDPGFVELHKDILGIEDLGKFIPADPEIAKSSADRFYGERSALMTLLSPIRYDGQWVVSAFSRAKKYSSNAAEEVINPRQKEWEPLFSVAKLLDDISERDEFGCRSALKREVPAMNMIPLLNHGRHMHYFAELICSELFLPMSPINYSGLASEYQKLVIRFGGLKTIMQAENEVLADVKALASYLGPSPRTGNLYRRTILLVPAMSGRSADYWCFGQSAILAGGLTTVFCNAVAGRQGVGGSCFIGRKSWEFSQEMLGMQSHVTPYSGWSRGIFYNAKTDALGEIEQAVVIADIDPTSMNEGRPRQQALPIPLQLVAYLPIAETVIKNGVPIHPSKVVGLGAEQVLAIEEKQYKALKKTLDTLDVQSMSGKIIDPQKGALSRTGAEFSGFLGESEKPFLKRLEHWNKHWRDQPYAGLPPSLVDWLWVDLTPEQGEKLPLLFVPPWTTQNSDTD